MTRSDGGMICETPNTHFKMVRIAIMIIIAGMAGCIDGKAQDLARESIDGAAPCEI